MKKIFFFFAAAATLFTSEAKAQLTNDIEGYRRFEASFLAQRTNFDGECVKTKGFELGYIQGINITTKRPLFLELGGQLAFSHDKDEINKVGADYTDKYTFMSIAIPINVAYKFTFTNSDNFTIVPFIGPNFKFNLIGKNKCEGDHDYKISFFNKDDMYGKDNTAKRFQVGLNLGFGVNILERLYVGYRFQPDFAKYIKHDDFKVKTKANYITFGVNF